MGPRFRGDDDVLVLDGKPVILIPAFDDVENLALHRIGAVGGVLALTLVLDRRIGKSLFKEARRKSLVSGGWIIWLEAESFTAFLTVGLLSWVSGETNAAVKLPTTRGQFLR
jgi:hypothetical protein